MWIYLCIEICNEDNIPKKITTKNAYNTDKNRSGKLAEKLLVNSVYVCISVVTSLSLR